MSRSQNHSTYIRKDQNWRSISNPNTVVIITMVSNNTVHFLSKGSTHYYTMGREEFLRAYAKGLPLKSDLYPQNLSITAIANHTAAQTNTPPPLQAQRAITQFNPYEVSTSKTATQREILTPDVYNKLQVGNVWLSYNGRKYTIVSFTPESLTYVTDTGSGTTFSLSPGSFHSCVSSWLSGPEIPEIQLPIGRSVVTLDGSPVAVQPVVENATQEAGKRVHIGYWQTKADKAEVYVYKVDEVVHYRVSRNASSCKMDPENFVYLFEFVTFAKHDYQVGDTGKRKSDGTPFRIVQLDGGVVVIQFNDSSLGTYLRVNKGPFVVDYELDKKVKAVVTTPKPVNLDEEVARLKAENAKLKELLKQSYSMLTLRPQGYGAHITELKSLFGEASKPLPAVSAPAAPAVANPDELPPKTLKASWLMPPLPSDKKVEKSYGSSFNTGYTKPKGDELPF